MNEKKISLREHLLIIMALLVAIGVCYFLLRYSSAQKELAELTQRAEETVAKQKGINLPNDAFEELRHVEKEKSKIEQALTEERQWLSLLEKRVVPAHALEIVNGIQVEISELAKKSGLRLIENTPYIPTDAGFPRYSKWNLAVWDFLRLAEASPIRRPLRRFQFAASYNGVKQFLRELDALSFQVTIVQYVIEVADNSDMENDMQASKEPLVATFIIAL